MLLHLQAHPRPHSDIHLVFGTRTQGDLMYRAEMEALASTLPGFYYHPVLSRETWEGHRGYVHAVYEELCAARPPAEFMLCGWKDMVDEAKARILAMGYEKKAIHLELYG
jgi:CDP-4-dehydro-6-deoxyglucose reductase